MACRDDNNAHPNLPEPNPGPDIFASTSLEKSKDKDALLKNIGYLCGTRVDNNDGPRRLTRQVAEFTAVNPPFVQEVNDLLTETIATTTERETNYVHQGWSINAASTICPWTSSRIAANNQPNAAGTWLTRRTLVKRLSVEVSVTDLAAVSEFSDDIEAALRRPTVFQQFEAVYRTLHEWGDVVPLEIEMGISMAFTDLEINMSQLPATADWHNTYYLTTIRTGRTTRQEGTNYLNWKNDVWPQRTIPPLDWRQIRVIKAAPTIELLSSELQGRLSRLYTKRLSYVPAITIGPGDSYSRTYDDTTYAKKQISSVVIYASDWVRSMRFNYADKTCSIKHEGTDQHGSECEFKLTEGEHIIEMLIWKNNGPWIGGVQFITSLGRCSPHFGGSANTPSVVRSKGGVLIGVVSQVKQHEWGRLFSKIQGVWRHDVLDRVPKECDVFSDYFGSNNGRPFNDRVVVRNSNMAISQIEVSCGNAIDSIQFTYVDGTNPGRSEFLTERHGGLGGSKKPPFVLDSGEHIVSISGKYDNNRITQLTFVTNQGRCSDIFGGGNDSQSFSALSPKDSEGKRMRLQYICGKCDTLLNGVMFVWTPT